MTTPVLIIGKPHSGKTTFIAQLYSRIDSNTSIAKLYKPVGNLTPIIEALRSLAKGEEVIATPTDSNTTITLPLQLDTLQVDLFCPDYGGEQINSIIDNREVDTNWNDLIKISQNWLLFIRPSSISKPYDLSNKTVKPEILESGSVDTQEFSLSDQSSYIELLQIFLHVKGQDAHFKNSTTKLTIVLTCWDEINAAHTPKELLQKDMPLLFEFIESNWVNEKIIIIGLSSLGLSLQDSGSKEKYLLEGSEKFGYVISDDSEKVQDIAELILKAL